MRRNIGAEIIKLARSGRSSNELAREFEPPAHAIRKWVKQAALAEGLRYRGLNLPTSVQPVLLGNSRQGSYSEVSPSVERFSSCEISCKRRSVL
jgi:transposase-like protein